MLVKLVGALAHGVRAVVVLLATVMLASLSLQVFCRFVLGQALSWTEELALGCFSWSMLLAIALGLRELIHVRMDLLVDRLPVPAAKALDRLIHLAIAALALFLCWAGTGYVVDSLGTTSAAIGYPIAWLYSAVPASAAILAIFALERVLRGPLVTPPSPAAQAGATGTAVPAQVGQAG